jgi:KDO2-lipid IV(A) lauroyltransferase
MTARHWAEYAAFRAALALAGRVPPAQLRRAAAAGARRFFDRGGRRVGYALINLRIAFPELDEGARRAIGRESYVHTAWNALDTLLAFHWSERQIAERVELVGLEHLRAALALGRGVLGLTLHLGSFELAAKAVPLHGVPVTLVARPMANRRLYAWLVRERTRTGAQLIDREGAARDILHALRAGRVVEQMIDQYAKRKHAVFAPLFGKRCSTTASVATFALRTGAPVVPFYTHRVGADHHRAVLLPRLELAPSGDRERDIERATARCNQVLEGIIRAHPEQWMWAHRRFRHSPDLPDLHYD